MGGLLDWGWNFAAGPWGGGNTAEFGSPIWEFLGAAGQDVMKNALNSQSGNVASAQNLMDQLTARTGELYTATQPARESAIKRANDILAGRYDPAASPAYSPMRRAVENSYGGAKENILASLPTGGVQQQSLADLEGQRAGNLSDIMSQIMTSELQNAYTTAGQSFPQMLQGFQAATGAGGLAGQEGGSILNYLAQLMAQASVGSKII